METQGLVCQMLLHVTDKSTLHIPRNQAGLRISCTPLGKVSQWSEVDLRSSPFTQQGQQKDTAQGYCENGVLLNADPQEALGKCFVPVML